MKSLLVLVVLFCLSVGILASEGPKLIILISYDQLRGDRLTAFKEDLSPNGFARVLREGVVFDSCFYNHAVTMTAPGHAVLMTGTEPKSNGIVANDYFDKSRGEVVLATNDTAGVLSPRNMLRPTLGQLLKEQSPQSKVFGFSIKDRASILMTGLKADGAYWLVPKEGGFGTSAYYKTPSWLKQYNRDHDLSKFAGQTWNPLQPKPTLPDPNEMMERMKQNPKGDPSKGLPRLTKSQRISLSDSLEWEGNFPDGGTVFPHIIPAYASKNFWEAFVQTPFSVDWLMDVAKTCILKEKMGTSDHADILCLGISTTDEVGHVFGPNSREMKEIIMSCDRNLSRFIDFLDDEIGRQNYEIVISADHGVAEIPENLFENEGRRFGRIHRKEIVEAMESPFQQFKPLSIGGEQADAAPGFMKHFLPPFIYLDSAVVSHIAGGFQASCDTLCSLIRAVDGVGYAVPTKVVLSGQCPAYMDPSVFNLVRNSVHPDRSGDIVFYPKRGWLVGTKKTTHGTPYDYDRYVPLMFFGGTLKSKSVSTLVSPSDLAPTLAEQLKIAMKNVDGSALDLR